MFSKELKDSIKWGYETSEDDLAKKLYNPLLSSAKLYQRVSAYFSINSLALYSIGLQKIAENDGRVQFVISSEISAKDYDEISLGYSARPMILELLQNHENVKNNELKKNLGDLACLIALNKADVKFALIKSKKGIFHDKFGLITDELKQTCFFTGSSNESIGGLKDNYESLSVDVSWDSGSRSKKRIEESQKRFLRLWDGTEKGILTVYANEVVYKELKKYKSDAHEVVKKMLDKKPGRFQLVIIESNQIEFQDYTESQLSLTDRRLRHGGALDKYCVGDTRVLRNDLTYADLGRVVDLIKKRADRNEIDCYIDPKIMVSIDNKKYSINLYKTQGIALKDPLNLKYEDEFEKFSSIVQDQVVRKLQPLHLRAAFYEYLMQKAANFSVPGSGKTAMILGVFAYLNSKAALQNEFINKILVVCPINAFQSWIGEFKSVFGDKKPLTYINVQDSKFDGDLRRSWAKSNLVLINYESLSKYENQLGELLKEDTMLIFDEVHRVKNPNGVGAQCVLRLAPYAKFKFVLTGTPIPNSYADIYNFLHILYGPEYNSYFGWSVADLTKPNYYEIQSINNKLQPFFWRTNKKQLHVPPADPDIFIRKSPSLMQRKLISAIWSTEKSTLAIFIRLIQASTNPGLLESKIDFSNMGFDEGDSGITKDTFNDALNESDNEEAVKGSSYSDFDLDQVVAPKFIAGIEKVVSLVSAGKKVLVWGIFVDTLKKIQNELENRGIGVTLIYGGTPKKYRTRLINEFKDKDSAVSVLVSNPQTLGESMSLQRTVHDAVYFEYNFNLTFMLQSRDRIHRLGLKSTDYTRYYYLQTVTPGDSLGFIDEQIYEKLKIKEKRMADAIDGELLVPDISDNYLEEVRSLINAERKRVKL
ncbi:helicase SNF2 [Lactobacillus sp. PFC-70]|nr:helicase SNF2 [Lactobacillus sp. PFC-70]